jgi:CubicO group peptidase (beta-lactamase class C family)
VVYIKPQLGFREGYIYNNLMFASAGAVMETVTGDTWEEITRKRIFQPLQMNASFFTAEEMIKNGNFAYAYYSPDSSNHLQNVTRSAQSPGLGPAGTIIMIERENDRLDPRKSPGSTAGALRLDISILTRREVTRRDGLRVLLASARRFVVAHLWIFPDPVSEVV